MEIQVKKTPKPRYNPLSPDRYPVAWSTATRTALTKPDWVSVDWSRGEAGAVASMKRLRAFAKGILLYPDRLPDVAQKLANGYKLTFRKRIQHGVWDVQLRFVEKAPLTPVLLEALSGK